MQLQESADAAVADELECENAVDADTVASAPDQLSTSGDDVIVAPSEIKEVKVKYRWYRTTTTRAKSVVMKVPYSDVRISELTASAIITFDCR